MRTALSGQDGTIEMQKSITCPLCGEVLKTGTLRAHKIKAHKENKPAKRAKRPKRILKDKASINTAGIGSRTKSSDWKKVK